MEPSAPPPEPPPGTASPPPVPPRARRGLILPALIAAGALGGGYCWYGHRERPRAGAEARGGTPDGSAPGRERSHRGRRAPGRLRPPQGGGLVLTTAQAASGHAFEHAELFAKVSGHLEIQNVAIGDRARIGQLLAVVEDPEIDKAVEQNEAALHQANARVAVVGEKITSAEAAKVVAEAMVEQQNSEVAAKLSNQNLQRKQLDPIAGLVAGRAVEAKLQDEQQDRYEVTTADLGVARATVLTARARVLARAALVSKVRADLAEARTDVEIAQANLEKAQVMQAYTRITSPYDGMIARRSYHTAATSSARPPRGATSRCSPSPGPTWAGSSCRSSTTTSPTSTAATRPPPWSSPSRGRPSPGWSRDTPRPRTRRAGTCGPRSTCPTPTTGSARGCTAG